MIENPFLDVLSVVCGCLDELGFHYALTGSVVSSIYGDAITSQVVDIFLKMSAADALRLDDALPPRFYRSVEALEQAAVRCGMANLIDTDTALKFDLCVARVQGARLDWAYLRHWAARLDLAEDLAALQQAAGI